MSKAWKCALSVILAITMTVCTVLPIFAVDGEEYICELRLIYAEDYDEAKDILEDSDFKDYELLDENLNEDTDEIGVWLAYKTTTDIEDAITDIAVMQMDGGYQEGNYQEMIQQSYKEYMERGEIYLDAIQYFSEAYDEGHFMTEVAFRQLNFYTVESKGIPDTEIPDFEGELLGDIFLDGITAKELATMFMEGNAYALRNIRALLAMGVSYNEDGLTYLDKVGVEVEQVTADPLLYANENYHDLAALISPTVTVFRDMFKELEAYEPELNYEDEEFTELEMKYLEYKSMAEMTRKVNYLDGKTLYDFCKAYKVNEEDYSSLYPLVAALNEGQVAMAQVAHYYDVVRYSMPTTGLSEEDILDELEVLEDEYGDNPFNIYTGVDRSIYRGSFALTSVADRANAFTEEGLMATLFEGQKSALNITVGVTGCVGAGLMLGTLAYHIAVKWPAWKAMSAYKTQFAFTARGWSTNSTLNGVFGQTPDQVANTIISKVYNGNGYLKWTFDKKMAYLEQVYRYGQPPKGFGYEYTCLKKEWSEVIESGNMKSLQADAEYASSVASSKLGAVGTLYVVGGLMILVSAITLGVSVINYYHPDYDDIPVAMVDLIETADGDRYIKYDVVFETEEVEEGVYAAADLNAFAGHRWNALYYTKSYEAGKPLLADEFYLSNSNNTPKDGYAPVHRFGENICYDLNKYVFEDDTSIYLSVKQSENQKAAVADVPELVGSMFGTGFLFLAGGIGLVAGIGGTLAVRGVAGKRKTKG